MLMHIFHILLPLICQQITQKIQEGSLFQKYHSFPPAIFITSALRSLLFLFLIKQRYDCVACVYLTLIHSSRIHRSFTSDSDRSNDNREDLIVSLILAWQLCDCGFCH